MKSNLSCLIGVVILWGVIVSCSSKAPNHDGNETNVVAADSIAADSIVGEKPISEQNVHSKKDFIKAFYQGLVATDYDFSFVKAYVTPKALQYLQDEYDKEYFCEDGDCLAVWLFAYEPGSDPGKFLSHRIEEVNENVFRVVTKYELADYVALVTIIEDGDTYKIDHVKQDGVDSGEGEVVLN